MKGMNGNLYALAKPYTTEDGKTLNVGTIYHYKDGHLYGHDSTNTFISFNAEPVPNDDIFLYEETPYNRERRERRERIATAAMQAQLTGLAMNGGQLHMAREQAAKEGKTLAKFVAEASVGYANALIDELIKQGD